MTADGRREDVCQPCAEAEIAVIFPVEGGMLSCGLRADLPKKQRRHEYVSLGTDWKNKGTEGIIEVEVLACLRCGRDKR